MPILKEVELYWCKLNPERPDRYQGQGPFKNTLQFRIRDKKLRDQLTKDYGFKFNADEDDDGKVFYKASLSRYTYQGLPDGGGDDLSKPNKPVQVVLADLTPVDPDTVGNGSIANVSFNVNKEKTRRTLKGVQLKKHIVYDTSDPDAFEMSDDFEVVQDEGGAGDSSEDDIY